MTACLIFFICFEFNNILKAIWNNYSTAWGLFFNFPPIPVGQTVLPIAIPLKALEKTYKFKWVDF